MDVILKSFSGIFLLLLLLITGAELISASIDARNASTYLANAAAEIGAANCAAPVIATWTDRAGQLDYEFRVTGITHSTTSEKRYAVATLTYDFELPLMDYSVPRTIRVRI